MSRRTVGACTAVNGERLGVWEPARQLFEPGEHLGCSWPQPRRPASARLPACTSSLIGRSYRPPRSHCCWQGISLRLRLLRMTYFENGVNQGSQIVLEGCHEVGVQTCAVWEASGGAELAVSVSFQMQRAFLCQPRLHNPSLCSWVRHIDFPGRPARLESLWPISPPCLFALKTAEVVIKMNKGFQAELSAEA